MIDTLPIQYLFLHLFYKTLILIDGGNQAYHYLIA